MLKALPEGYKMQNMGVTVGSCSRKLTLHMAPSVPLHGDPFCIQDHASFTIPVVSTKQAT